MVSSGWLASLFSSTTPSPKTDPTSVVTFTPPPQPNKTPSGNTLPISSRPLLTNIRELNTWQLLFKQHQVCVTTLVNEVKLKDAKLRQADRAVFVKTVDEKNESKLKYTIPFTEAAIQGQIVSVYSTTLKLNEDIRTSRGKVEKSSGEEKQTALLQFCEQVKTISLEYGSLLNRIKGCLYAWRVSEDFVKFALSMPLVNTNNGLVECVQSQIDDYLSRCVSTEIFTLTQYVYDILNDFKRAEDSLRKQLNPAYKPTVNEEIAINSDVFNPILWTIESLENYTGHFQQSRNRLNQQMNRIKLPDNVPLPSKPSFFKSTPELSFTQCMLPYTETVLNETMEYTHQQTQLDYQAVQKLDAALQTTPEKEKRKNPLIELCEKTCVILFKHEVLAKDVTRALNQWRLDKAIVREDKVSNAEEAADSALFYRLEGNVQILINMLDHAKLCAANTESLAIAYLAPSPSVNVKQSKATHIASRVRRLTEVVESASETDSDNEQGSSKCRYTMRL